MVENPKMSPSNGQRFTFWLILINNFFMLYSIPSDMYQYVPQKYFCKPKVVVQEERKKQARIFSVSCTKSYGQSMYKASK